MMTEPLKINELYETLKQAKLMPFPKRPKDIQTSNQHGVYVIYRNNGTPVHVGRTIRGKYGLRQRLVNHMQRKSSFTRNQLQSDQSIREGYSYRCIEVESDRERCLLESLACGKLCPEYVGLGRNKQ